MSTASHVNQTSEFTIADRLKNQLVEFVTAGPLQKEFDQQRKTYFDEFGKTDDSEWEGVLDWFLFDWFDDNGQGVVDHFLERQDELSTTEKDILEEWRDSLNSVFHVRSVTKSTLALRDLDSGYDLTVTLTRKNSHELFKKGDHVVARLLPIGDHLVLSGLQYVLPDRKSAMAWLELRDKVDELHNPEEIEKAIKESCTAFCQLFGCDELTVPSSKLTSTLRRFQDFLLKEYRDGLSGTTAAERFKSEVGRELEVIELPEPPETYAEAADVTILCDDFDGIVVLPDYSRFKRVFATDEPDKEVPDWRQLVWSYIKNPEIPIVAFERIAEQHPARVERVLRVILGNNNFSLEHLYAALLHYKQPVEGLDDLEDDEQLWDLFNGNAKPSGKAIPPNKATVKKPSKPRRAAVSKRKSAVKAAPKSAAKAAPKSTSSRRKAATGSAKLSSHGAKSGARRRS
jgi:hypothetical protein